MSSIGTVSGEAIVYDSVTRIGGLFDEVIAPGAAARFLRSPEAGEVALVINHDASRLLARARSGTLMLTDSSSALRVRATLPDNTHGRDTLEAMRRGDLYRMSFSFVVSGAGETWHEGKDGVPLRVVRDIHRMYDVSIVTWPAYDATSVHLEHEGTGGRSSQLRRLELAAAADRLATYQRARFGDEVYGRQVKPPKEAADLARANRLRVHLDQQAACPPTTPDRKPV